MANSNYTLNVSLGTIGGNVPVFVDNRCTQRATVFDSNGNALKGNALVVPEKQAAPVMFQTAQTVTTVYFRNAEGGVVALTSSGGVTVTKADGVTAVNTITVPVGL